MMKMHTLSALALSTALFALSSPAMAQNSQEAPATAPQVSDPIVVEGVREERRKVIRKYADTITRRPRVDKPVERFLQPLCPKVSGMKEAYAKVIENRVRANAQAVEINVAEADCKPNIYIMFLRNADEELRMAAKNDSELFESLLSYQKDRVFDETGPVRAWNYAEVRDDRGRALAYDTSKGSRGAAINKTAAATRLRSPVSMETMAAIVVFDVSALPGRSLNQLADYATMRVLAPVREVSDPSGAPFDSILSLFADDFAPQELTVFDRAYLQTLYNNPATLNPLDLYARVATAMDKMENNETLD
ncbi:hypothetical protein [Alteripontixanthobacter maritimus]|nr:hypothetical protein [Alteripontixanthobacter maritimus]